MLKLGRVNSYLFQKKQYFLASLAAVFSAASLAQLIICIIITSTGVTILVGNFTCTSSKWSITANFPAGTTSSAFSTAVFNQLTSGPGTDGGFSAGGCAITSVGGALAITGDSGCTDISIDFNGGTPALLTTNPTVNGLSFAANALSSNTSANAVPSLPGSIALFSLISILFGGMSAVLFKKAKSQRKAS